MTPGRIWAGCFLALFVPLTAKVVWRLLQEPAGFLWLVAVACVLITGGAIAAAVHRSQENIDLRAENEKLERECNAHAAENARLNGLLTDARVVMPIRPQVGRATVADVRDLRPDLSIVPPQRSDSWLEQVMDEQARLGEQQDGDAS